MVYALYVLRNVFFNLLNKSQQIEKCYFLSFLSAFFFFPLIPSSNSNSLLFLSPYPILYFHLSFFLVFHILSFISTSYPSFPCFTYIIFYFQRLILLFPYPIIIFIYPFPLFSHIFPYIVFYFPFPFSFFNKENYQFLSLKWYTFIFGVFFISIYNL